MKEEMVLKEMSIEFFFTISCHKIYTKSISNLHFNCLKRLNMIFMLQIFDKNWVPDLSGFSVGPNSDP